MNEIKAMLEDMEGAPLRVAEDIAAQALTYARANSRVDSGKLRAGWFTRVASTPEGATVGLHNRQDYAQHQKPDVAGDAIKAASINLDSNLKG